MSPQCEFTMACKRCDEPATIQCEIPADREHSNHQGECSVCHWMHKATNDGDDGYVVTAVAPVHPVIGSWR